VDEHGPSETPSPPGHAATVVLLRERAPEGLQVYLLERHRGNRFLGGVHVFPGGKLDPEDEAPGTADLAVGRTPEQAAAILGEEAETAPARALGLFIAGLRETFEEAGILLARPERTRRRSADVGQVTSPDARSDLRRRLLDGGEPFPRVVAEAGLRLPVDALVPHARWITPAGEPRRYDTRFFVAEVPSDAGEGSADQRETTHGGWWSPAAALAAEARREIALAPPTLRTLELLLLAGTAAVFFRDFCPVPPPRIEPVLFNRGGIPTLLFPGDSAHPQPRRPWPGPTRLVLLDGRWVAA